MTVASDQVWINLKSGVSILDELGDDGWELAASMPFGMTTTLIFKRRK